MDLLKIIKRYRSDIDPKLQQFDGKCLSTFSREDLLQVATKLKIQLNDILVLLDVDDTRENLCKVVSFALEQEYALKEDKVEEPPKKKNKTTENKSSGMKTLEEKIAELEKKLEKKQAEDELSEFERAKRDVKDEAAKGKVDIDVLHERLILLDNLARKQNHDLKDKINLILSRFHIHKSRPNFAAALVLKLVCNKEEEAILDKEQKLLKTFGFADDDNYNMQSHNLYMHGQGFMGNSFGQAQGHSYGMSPRFTGPPRRGRGRGNSHNLCFKCNKPGHYVRDCPANQNSSSSN
ncbi:uncharacterized protein [Mytilus edulis]|uniref:uncharacterized protein n=1 Tax=Mytilus edulis TaxID=6550 RepID=UPI0039EFF4DD